MRGPEAGGWRAQEHEPGRMLAGLGTGQLRGRGTRESAMLRSKLSPTLFTIAAALEQSTHADTDCTQETFTSSQKRKENVEVDLEMYCISPLSPIGGLFLNTLMTGRERPRHIT